MGPGQERIPNRGQKKWRVKTANDQSIKSMTFQDANVRKPLAAVSGITARNNVVFFDKKGSFIVPADSAEVEDIRRLVMRAKNRIELEEKKGVYVMPIWVDESAGFTRQGNW